MTTHVAHAPGKLFLVGEYVVLRGAPALVAAVNRYAEVSFAESAGSLAVTSLAEGIETSAAVGAGSLPGGDVGAVLAVAGTLGVEAGRFVVNTRAFLDGSHKLGLGRSAATIVAATAAILATRGERTRGALKAAALAANHRFQGGHGSGGDVAAAVHGGVVEVRRAGDELRAAPSRLPTGLEMVVAWSGTGAHTVPLVEKFVRAGTCRSLSELGTVAETAVDAATRDDAEEFLAAVDRAGALLQVVGRDLDLPIVTPPLARLLEVAARLGVAAKPSGAGAGDCVVAFARSAAEADALRTAWRAADFVPLALAIEHEGARVE